MRSDTIYALRYAFAVVLLLFAMWVGVQLPDADLSWLRLRPLIFHRSLLTHGLILPLFLFLQFHTAIKGKANQKSDPLARLGLLGFLIGTCVHLAFDYFPRGWHGTALIYVPLYGWISPLFSQAWIAVSILGGLYLDCRLLRSGNELFFSLIVSLVAFMLCAQTNPTPTALKAFLMLGGFGLVAFIIPRPAVNHADAATLPSV